MEDEVLSARDPALGCPEHSPRVNLWFVVPNDDRAFFGDEQRDDVRCAHQAYFNLKDHPEHARNAAHHRWSRLLTWCARG